MRLIYVRFTYVRLTFWPPIADVADCGLSCEGGLPVDLRLAARLGLPVESGLRGGARSGRRFPLRGAGIRVVVLPAHGQVWMHFLQESLRWYWCPLSSVQPSFTHVSRETARGTVVAPWAVISRYVLTRLIGSIGARAVRRVPPSGASGLVRERSTDELM